LKIYLQREHLGLNNNRTVKIFLTGGRSLLANNIANFLCNLGHDVHLFGRSVPQKIDGIKFSELNWNNLDSIFNPHREIDLLIHCAGINAHQCELDPNEALRFNSYLTGKLSELCALNKVKNFIFFSSVHAYGNNLNGLITEEFIPNSFHPYGFSKYVAEKLVQANLDKSNTKFLILRLSNIIATPIDMKTSCWHLLPNSLCKELKKSKSLVLKSNPNIKRDFVAISELNKFIKYFLLNQEVFESGIYNFASGQMMKIYDLAKLIRKINFANFGEEVEIIIDQNKLSNIDENYNFSIKKIKDSGFNLSQNIDKELLSMLNFSSSIHSKLKN
tara:strand:- start:232 stop:1224 length:993 start_codon:yes stop_codon:yes gene_type:complete